MSAIIDTNADTTAHLRELQAAGVCTIIRYLNPLNPGGTKCVKPAEAHAIAAAGLRLALVCEGWGDFAHGGISASAGARDGAWCAHYAPTVGAPKNACIYFAVDADAGAAQIAGLVIPYFAAARIPITATGYRVGVYGSGNVCAAVIAAGLAERSWLSCSLGWAGSRAYLSARKWALCQHTPRLLCGIDTDANDANGEFGDFVPFADEDIAVAPEPPPTPSTLLSHLERILGIT